MSNLIDRQAAIMQAKNIRYDADIRADKAIVDVIYALEQLPPAQSEPQWIPCSDCKRRCKKWEHSKTLQE